MTRRKMGSVNVLLVALIVLKIAASCDGGVTSNYNGKFEPSIDMPFDSDVFRVPKGYNAPEQVHITQGDHVGRSVIVSWVTPLKPFPNILTYGRLDGKQKKSKCSITSYKYYNYTSGFIHHCSIHNLEYNTEYFYELGHGNATRRFSFTTPPKAGPDVPYTFGVIGDLGQTFDSNQTLENYLSHPNGQSVLFVGDLSYADHYSDHDQRRWDTWGRFVEKSTAYQPWIWTAGNHELDVLPEFGESTPFKPYKHRYRVPYKASGSTSPLWYSIKRASAYIIVLSSYSAYAKYTPQYNWLEKEFSKVDRAETPWLIVLVHSPLYNSDHYHYMEGESMRVMFEPWFVQNKVDIVFAGHVHAYERTERTSNIAYNITNRACSPVLDPSAPVYITIGDGGNIEGRANEFIYPQPNYSAYREASFGHGILDIKNRTHASFTWYRNDCGSGASIGDSLWLYNQHWHHN
ncbi:purple acid phosphatase 2-like [Magnolia sinica]|uniref:purple acid phosphatase 2-like n=1 Tax=Magnolia sinica TaxID=86752 RepID=UPI00265897BE|nr:purple acid phosphatase 2-like [Magnolia sinica]